LNLRDQLPGAARLSEALAGFSVRRSLPRWRSDVFADPAAPLGPVHGPELVLFADTFHRYFERETIDAALAVLQAGGYRLHRVNPADGPTRPFCCGRTFLSVGRVDEARREATRTVAALAPFAARGVPIVGLEPSCLLGFRDELPVMLRTDDAKRVAAH